MPMKEGRGVSAVAVVMAVCGGAPPSGLVAVRPDMYVVHLRSSCVLSGNTAHAESKGRMAV
jgi:hypothetical protein